MTATLAIAVGGSVTRAWRRSGRTRRYETCLLHGAHPERHAATTNRHFPQGQRVGHPCGAHEDVLGDQRFALEVLGEVLQPRGYVHRVAECSEHDVLLVADVADD